MSRPRILVFGWIGSTNLGDELIAAEVCELVHDNGGIPTAVTVAPDVSARPDVATVRHRGPFDTPRLLWSLRRHDGAVFGGGGLIQDETGPLNIPFHVGRLAAARIARLPWVGVGLGFGTVRRSSGKAIVGRTLRDPVAIAVRDHQSVERCRGLTGITPELAADPVFAGLPRTVVPSDDLVVSLRRANSPGQRSLRSTDAPDDAVVQHWADVVDTIAARHSLRVRFVAWEREQDDPLHRAVAAAMRTPATCETPSLDRIVDRMARGRMMLSMRYHGVISALLHLRPVVAINYSPKMCDLVAECPRGVGLADLDADPETVADRLDAVMGERDARVTARSVLIDRAAVNSDVVARLVAAAARRRGND